MRATGCDIKSWTEPPNQHSRRCAPLFPQLQGSPVVGGKARQGKAGVQQFTCALRHAHCRRRPSRTFVIEGEDAAVGHAIDIITAAVDRYKELCEGRCQGGVHGSQLAAGGAAQRSAELSCA